MTEPEKTGKIRVTIVKEYTPVRKDYRYWYDEAGVIHTRTDEEIETLTVQSMVEADREAYEKGEFGLDDLLEFGSSDIEELKWEAVE